VEEDMKVLVIYDSVFGNTERIARAISETLMEKCSINIVHVMENNPIQMAEADMVVVGSPTRGFQPTPAVKKYLKGLPVKMFTGKKVAAFDTRMKVEEVNNIILTFMSGVFGYAAKPIGKDLVKHGGELVTQPEGFFVEGAEGPLKPGELDRAKKWAERLLAT
jgi:flavodoxin